MRYRIELLDTAVVALSSMAAYGFLIAHLDWPTWAKVAAGAAAYVTGTAMGMCVIAMLRQRPEDGRRERGR